MTQTAYRSDVEFHAKQYSLDPDLVEAVVIEESKGQADAFRPEPAFFEHYLAGKVFYERFNNPRRVGSSYGLMQIMYPVAVEHGFTKQPEYLFLPNVNLDLGCLILAELLRKHPGRVEDALAAYNGGAGGVDRPAPKAYAQRVLGHLAAIKAAR